eukprot:13164447-Alexandrium_andersonii.AAC.1
MAVSAAQPQSPPSAGAQASPPDSDAPPTPVLLPIQLSVAERITWRTEDLDARQAALDRLLRADWSQWMREEQQE